MNRLLMSMLYANTGFNIVVIIFTSFLYGSIWFLVDIGLTRLLNGTSVLCTVIINPRCACAARVIVVGKGSLD